MEFIKFKGSTTKTALYPKEKLLSIDLINSQSMRIRIGTMATKTTATATATISGNEITAVTVTNPGGIYAAVPTLTETANGGNATYTVTVSNGVVKGIAAGGTNNNYSSAPTLEISAPEFASTAYDEIRLNIKEGSADRVLTAIMSPGDVTIEADAFTHAIEEIGVFTKGNMMLLPNTI
jgi:hypothetical protein